MSGIGPRQRLALALAALLACAGTASAQTGDPRTAPAPSAGALVLEELEDGIVFNPQNRFTRLDGDLGNLVGGSVGVLGAETLLVGAGGYWLTNGDRHHSLGYGGLVVEWSPARDRRFSFSLGGLLGAGEATLPVEVRGFAPSPRGRGRPQAGPEPERIAFSVPSRRNFLVFEPQANAVVRLTRWLRLGLGVGYRLVDGAGSLDGRLDGVSGSLALQVGSF